MPFGRALSILPLARCNAAHNAQDGGPVPTVVPYRQWSRTDGGPKQMMPQYIGRPRTLTTEWSALPVDGSAIACDMKKECDMKSVRQSHPEQAYQPEQRSR